MDKINEIMDLISGAEPTKEHIALCLTNPNLLDQYMDAEATWKEMLSILGLQMNLEERMIGTQMIPMLSLSNGEKQAYLYPLNPTDLITYLDQLYYVMMERVNNSYRHAIFYVTPNEMEVTLNFITEADTHYIEIILLNEKYPEGQIVYTFTDEPENHSIAIQQHPQFFHWVKNQEDILQYYNKVTAEGFSILHDKSPGKEKLLCESVHRFTTFVNKKKYTNHIEQRKEEAQQQFFLHPDIGTFLTDSLDILQLEVPEIYNYLCQRCSILNQLTKEVNETREKIQKLNVQ